MWVVGDGEAYYPSLVCYNGKSKWRIRIEQWWAFTHNPSSAHYEFQFPRQKPKPVEGKFDRLTGKPEVE
jgi:hypothetical protein